MADDTLDKLRQQLYADTNEIEIKTQNNPESSSNNNKKIEIREIKEEKIEKKPEEEKKEIKKEEVKEGPEKNNEEKKEKKVIKKTSKKTNKKNNSKRKPKKKKNSRKKARRKSKKKKFEIRNYLVPIAIFVVILIIALALKFVVFDNKEVVAYVNNEPIYLSEINQRYESYQGTYSKEIILNQTITETLLLQKAEKKELSITDAEFNAMLQSYYEMTGMTEEDLMAQLKEQGISYKVFKKDYKEALLMNKLLEEYVLTNITVTEEEMRNYFNEIKSELNESVTYSDVKDLVNQTVLIEKRNQAFNEYVSELREEADIVIFESFKEEIEEDNNKNIELAKCLTENNVVMYSSTSCSACLSQKRMFGDAAVSELEIVECDTEESRDECQALAIKATPTWIVNNIKYTGVLALESLADLAGCEF